MIDFIAQGGVPMAALVVVAFVVATLAVRAWRHLGTDGDVDAGASAIDAVLFWGAVAVVIGLVGTLLGLGAMATAIEAAGTAPAPLIWGGVRAAVSTTLAGSFVFLAALAAWAVLRARLRRVH